MSTGFQIAIDLVKDVFMDTSVFGNYWIYQLMILFGSMILITRAWKDWGELALPVITGWHLVGFKFNYIFFVVSGMLFIINTVSMKEVMGGLSTIKNIFVDIGSRKIIKSPLGKAEGLTRRRRLEKFSAKSLKEYEKKVESMEAKLKPYEREYGITEKMKQGKGQYERQKLLEPKIIAKEIKLARAKRKKLIREMEE